MSTYRVTLSFDMTALDDQVIQEIAHRQMRAMVIDSGKPVVGIATTATEAADYASQDLRVAFHLTATAMLSEGGALVPGLSVTKLVASSEHVAD